MHISNFNRRHCQKLQFICLFELPTYTPCCRPSVGGDVISLVISDFPLIVLGTSVRVMFSVYGNSLSSNEVQVIYSNALETSLTFLTPPIDMKNSSSTLATVFVFSNSDLSVAVNFNYTYYAASSSVQSFSPTSGKDSGGDSIWVKLKYFPFPTDIVAKFGETEVVAKVMAGSSVTATSILLITPFGLPAGQLPIDIFPKSCQLPCKYLLTIQFTVIDSKELVLASSVPSSASYQQLSESGTFPAIQIQNAHLSIIATNQVKAMIQSSARKSTLMTNCTKITTRDHDNTTLSIWLAFPKQVLNEPDQIVLTIYLFEEQSKNRSISFSFRLFDARQTRLVSATPLIIPVTGLIRGKSIVYSLKCILVFSNLFADIGGTTIYIVTDQSSVSAEVQDVQMLSICAEGIDCNRTSISVKLPPISDSGFKGVLVNRSGFQAQIFYQVLQYTAGCDYDTFCGDRIPDYRSISASPSISCQALYCIDPSAITSPVLISSTPSRGPATGGTIVTVWVQNLPAFASEDIMVSLANPSFKVSGNVLSLETNGTMQSNRACIQIRVPAIEGPLLGYQTFLITVSLGGTTITTKFPFRYSIAVTGPPVIISYNPSVLYVGSNLNARFVLSNIPELDKTEFGYDASVLGLTLIDPLGTIKDAQLHVDSADGNSGTFFSSAGSCMMLGLWSFKITTFHSKSISNSTSFTVSVIDLPKPYVNGWFPLSCQSDVSVRVDVVVRYLSKEIYTNSTSGLVSGGDIVTVLANLLTPDGLRTALNITDFKTISSSCTSRECAASRLSVLTPTTGNPEGKSSSTKATISLQFLWQDPNGFFQNFTSAFPFRYLDPSEAQIESMFPTNQLVGSNSLVILKLKNMRCLYLAIYFDKPINSTANILNCQSVASGKSVIVEFQPPVHRYMDIVNVTVSDNKGTVKTVFTYLPPPLDIYPADGPSDGGYEISVTAEGIPNAGLAAVSNWSATVTDQASGASFPADILNHIVFSSALILKLNVPTAFSLLGGLSMIRIYSDDGQYSAEGIFNYFQKPLVTSISPQRASIFGETSSTDDRSVSVSVQGFPMVLSSQRIQISFVRLGTTVLCDNVACGIMDIQNSMDLILLKVQVPKFSVGSCQIIVTYNADWPMQNRTASVDFEFYIPLPTIRSIRYCRSCPTCKLYEGCPPCIQGGLCKSDRTKPLTGKAAVSSKLCTNGDACGGALQIEVKNMPEVLFSATDGQINSSSLVTCSFGPDGILFGIIRRVVSQADRILRIEFLPPQITLSQVVTATLSVFPPSSLIGNSVSFPIFFFDDSVQMTCESGACQGPSSGKKVFSVDISNLPLQPDSSFQDQFTVTVNDQNSKILAAYVFSDHIKLQILPPPLSDEAFVVASLTVNVNLLSSVDSKIYASTAYKYWVTPRVLHGRFSTFAESISIVFDADTNPGAKFLNGSCIGTLNDRSLLGTNPKCMWPNRRELIIYTGFGAAVVPGSTLKVLNIQSLGGISDMSSLDVTVMPPEISSAPIVSLQGPAVIDVCSPLQISALSQSPRPLIFTWSCMNDEGLNAVLSGVSGSLISFPEGTPSMQASDKNYTISVQGTDFLGVRSALISIFVFKKSSPVPSFTFSPPSLQILRSQVVDVKGNAEFSSCSNAKTKILFSWIQLSGPSIIPDKYMASFSQLIIPGNVLREGSSYTVALIAKMSEDPSQTSRAQYTIKVLTQSSIAQVSGGGGEIWAGSPFLLNASGSMDLDLESWMPQGFDYSWSCDVQDDSGLRNICFSAEGLPLVLSSTPQILISANALPPSVDNIPYRFTVTVSKHGKIPATASTNIYVREDPIPVVSLTADAETSAFQNDGSLLINIDSRLILHSFCSSRNSTGATSVLWSLPSEFNVTAMSSAGQLPLGLQSNSLVVAGGIGNRVFSSKSPFAITLFCSDDFGIGQTSLIVQINEAPSGGMCEACSFESALCAKTGKALIDIFRMQCNGWMDNNLPIKYQFGLQALDNNGTITWFAWSTDHSMDFLLPYGEFAILAAVQDSLAATTQIIKESVSAVLGVRRATGNDGTNQDLQAFAQVDGAMASLDDLLMKGAVWKIDPTITSFAIDIDRITGSNVNSAITNAAKQRREHLLSVLGQAAQSTILTSNYICDALAAAQQITLTGNLNNASVRLAMQYLQQLLLSEDATVIDVKCATSAAGFLSATMQATSKLNFSSLQNGLNSSDDSLSISAVLNWHESSAVTIFKKVASDLLQGEGLVLSSSTSILELRRLGTRGGNDYSICSEENSVAQSAACTRWGLNVTIPSFLDAEFPLQGTDNVDLITCAHDHSPGADVSQPLMVVGLFIPGHQLLHVQNITRHIQLGFTASSGPFNCVFWDEAIKDYSQNGIITVNNQITASIDQVTCFTSHLSSFTLLPAQKVPGKTSTLQPTLSTSGPILSSSSNSQTPQIGLTIIPTVLNSNHSFISSNISSTSESAGGTKTDTAVVVVLVAASLLFVSGSVAALMIVIRRNRSKQQNNEAMIDDNGQNGFKLGDSGITVSSNVTAFPSPPAAPTTLESVAPGLNTCPGIVAYDLVFFEGNESEKANSEPSVLKYSSHYKESQIPGGQEDEDVARDEPGDLIPLFVSASLMYEGDTGITNDTSWPLSRYPWTEVHTTTTEEFCYSQPDSSPKAAPATPRDPDFPIIHYI